MTDNGVARATLESIQRSAYLELTLPVPDLRAQNMSAVRSLEQYLATNPDITPEDRRKWAAQREEQRRQALIDRPDIANFTGAVDILAERVDQLKSGYQRLDPGHGELSNICFGTIPGGGLDAYTLRTPAAEEFAVIVPEGFFSLANLFTKLIVQLQPIVADETGPVYLPSASMQQFSALARQPHLLFRLRDVMRAYFLNGDPHSALPYTHALPFQDRFEYLLSGTELFLLAHEVAHVVLGHLGADGVHQVDSDRELEADSLALRLVAAHFDATDRPDRHPMVRATLCGLMFHSMNRLWEDVMRGVFGAAFDARSPREHPPSEEREERFRSDVVNLPEGETPGWALHVFNAIRLATELLPGDMLADLIAEAHADGLHARAAPQSLSHLCRSAPVDMERCWSETTATLIVSAEPEERMLGLWFLQDMWPESVRDLYVGLRDDDDEWRELCARTLVAVEPMYEDYLPRLLERFRETTQGGEFEDYLLSISRLVVTNARMELGQTRIDVGPWDPSFFAANGGP